MKLTGCCLLGASLTLAFSIAHAQQPSGPAAPATAGRRAIASRATAAPTIDGVLDEPAWQQAIPIGDFIQSEPFQGQPATERTEVRVLFTASTIYVGVICFDSDPTGIVTTDSRRDSALTGQDSFQIIFDTYHDRQNGFIFGTNSVGVQYDAQVRNEGETTRGGPFTGTAGADTTGAGGGLNVNWDGTWDVKTRVTETGWRAEFAIPLRTLRYGPPPQTWGVNFSRNIERKRELVYWSPVSRIYTVARLSSAGELAGLDVPAPRDFKLIPYAISSSNRNFTSSSETKYAQIRDWGIDAKIGVTSSTTLDLTYNTDFAQVEVDEQQINLTRFNLLFPEKRPFFLENRGLFAVGRPGEIDLFFSRRIGIDDDGTLLPIQGGARLTGKAGGFNVGLLNMQTAAVDDTPANNFTAARLNKDLRNRSSMGVMFVNRQGTGSRAGPDDYNRTYSVDGKLGIRQAVSISAFAARTQTPGKDGRDYAYSSAFDFRTRAYEASFAYTEVGDDFNPEVGFLQRPDGYRQINTTFRRHLRTPGLARIGLRELEPHASYQSYWGFDGLQETATLHLDMRWDFENNYGFNSTGFNVQDEGLRKPFEVYPGVVVPAGHYRSPYFLGSANTDPRKWINAYMACNIGGFLSGTQVTLSPTLNIRRGGRVTSSLRWTRSDIDLPQGAFVTNLGSARLTYNFSTFVNASTLIQYNDRTRRWSTNFRFSWLRTAAAGFYLVYNDTESMNGLGPVSRAFVVKYAHQIDLLH
ncbi:MAG TPA: DUF5916 domain-containing protein [Vicinamibacterales bacterium]|nr:DUF5916 domain-containing protein [Vicinamibacterales bacterium]